MSAIRVEIELADGQFVTRMMRAGETVERFNENLRRSYPQLAALEAQLTASGTGFARLGNGTMVGFNAISKINTQVRSFTTTLRDLTIVLGLARSALANIQTLTTGWTGQIIQTNAEMERLTMLMRSMSTSSDPITDAAEKVRYLREMAKTVPFTLGALTNSFAKIKSTGVDPTIIAMDALTDSVAAFGGSDDIFKRATLAVTQMSGKGVIQMEELRQQLGEAIPRATELMARGMGVSYGELVKLIATGTVRSKEALSALYLELDRTFGGSSQRMMTTFSGQMMRMLGLVQSLQLNAGESGYFEIVKKQLRDINNFLNSSSGKQFAETVGKGLADIVGYLRASVDWVVRFRNEIMTVAKWMVTGFAISRAIAGLASIGAAITGMTLAYRLLSAQVAAYQARLINAQVAQAAAAAALGTTSAAAAFSGLTFAALGASVRSFGATLLWSVTTITGLRTAIYGLAVAIGAVAPWLPLLGLAIGATASYFGIFSDKGAEATAVLRDFTAASREELELAQAVQIAHANKLDAQADSFEKMNGNLEKFVQDSIEIQKKFGMGEAELADERLRATSMWEKSVTEKRQQASRERGEVLKAEGEFETRAAKGIARDKLDLINDELGVIKSRNDQVAVVAAKANEDARKVLLDARKDTSVLEEQYKVETAKRNSATYAEEIRFIQNKLLAEQYAMRAATENQTLVAETGRQITADLNKQLLQLYTNKAAADEIGMGVKTIAKEIDTKGLMLKAEELLNRLKASAVDYKAEIGGAHGETAKLIYLLDKAKFGDPDAPGMRKMIADLVEAQEEAATLNDVLKGKTDLENDAAALALKTKERLFQAEYGHLSEIDKLKMRITTGVYAGQGDRYSPLEKSMRGARDRTQEAKNNVDLLNTSLNNTFGGQSITLLDAFIQKISQLNGQLGGLRLAVDNSLGAALGVAGGTYAEKLKMRESGGNPNAIPRLSDGSRASSAQGTGQFIESTWMEFLKEMHPLAATLPREQALSLRKNEAVMTEGINWLKVKNDRALTKAGFETSNTNSYLAHLLGAGGAIQTLASSNERMMSTIMSSTAAKANPRLAGMTAGQLRNDVANSFGEEAKWQPSRLPMPGNIADKAASDIASAEADEKAALLREATNAQSAALRELQREAEKAAKQIEGLGDKEAEMRKQIEAGKLGPNLNPNDNIYAAQIAAAKKLDAVEDEMALKKKARTQIASDTASLAQKAQELAARRVEAMARISDPLEQKSSSALRTYINDLDKYVAAVGVTTGKTGKLYSDALAARLAGERNFRNTEALEEAATLQQKNIVLAREAMTINQSRTDVLNQEIARLRLLVQNFSGAANERAILEQTVTERIIRLREQAANDGPIRKQMRDWADYGQNIEQATTGWLTSATTQLAEFATTGKADFASMANSMIQDIIRITIQAMIAKTFGVALGGTSIGAPTNLLSLKTAHTGGVVGKLSGSTRVHPSAFDGAARYHVGGMVKKMGLKAGEVPIVAKEGEGVFTPEQMKAMGGRRGGSNTNNISIAPSITLNASGGTPEQNSDLAEKMQARLTPSLRALVVDELMTQMRPGNMLGAR